MLASPAIVRRAGVPGCESAQAFSVQVRIRCQFPPGQQPGPGPCPRAGTINFSPTTIGRTSRPATCGSILAAALSACERSSPAEVIASAAESLGETHVGGEDESCSDLRVRCAPPGGRVSCAAAAAPDELPQPRDLLVGQVASALAQSSRSWRTGCVPGLAAGCRGSREAREAGGTGSEMTAAPGS
jgi:hypothetical protein